MVNVLRGAVWPLDFYPPASAVLDRQRLENRSRRLCSHGVSVCVREGLSPIRTGRPHRHPAAASVITLPTRAATTGLAQYLGTSSWPKSIRARSCLRRTSFSLGTPTS